MPLRGALAAPPRAGSVEGGPKRQGHAPFAASARQLPPRLRSGKRLLIVDAMGRAGGRTGRGPLHRAHADGKGRSRCRRAPMECGGRMAADRMDDGGRRAIACPTRNGGRRRAAAGWDCACESAPGWAQGRGRRGRTRAADLEAARARRQGRARSEGDAALRHCYKGAGAAGPRAPHAEAPAQRPAPRLGSAHVGHPVPRAGRPGGAVSSRPRHAPGHRRRARRPTSRQKLPAGLRL